MQREENKEQMEQTEKKNIKVIDLISNILIITLNVNGLNPPSKRHRLAVWILIKTYIYAVYKWYISHLETHTDKMRGWKNVFQASGNQKKAGLEILISEKIAFKVIDNVDHGNYI